MRDKLAAAAAAPRVSVVVPIYNEAESLPVLHPRIGEAFDLRGEAWEVVYVDDGSSDGSAALLDDFAAKEPGRVRVLHLRVNSGKAAAYTAGFARARGAVIVTLDGDLQDDPAEAAKLIARLDQGYHLVTGWKHRGKGPASKRLPSYLFNAVVRTLTGVALHDFNCPFKAYRAEAARALTLTGDLYRFIPLILAAKGYRVAEEPVENYPRQFGHSKYGAARLVSGPLDLLTILFVARYAQKPLRLFGGAGVVSFASGFLIDAGLTLRGLLVTGKIGHQALLLMGVFLMLLGIQLVGLGLLGELVIARTAASPPEVVEGPLER